MSSSVRHSKLDNNDLYQRQMYQPPQKQDTNGGALLYGQLRAYAHPKTILNTGLSRVNGLDDHRLSTYWTEPPKPEQGHDQNIRNIISSYHPVVDTRNTEYLRIKGIRADLQGPVTVVPKHPLTDAEKLIHSDRLFGNINIPPFVTDMNAKNTRTNDIDNALFFQYNTYQPSHSFSMSTALQYKNGFPAASQRLGTAHIGENTRSDGVDNTKIFSYLVSSLSHNSLEQGAVNASFEHTRHRKTQNSSTPQTRFDQYPFNSIPNPHMLQKKDIDNIYGTGTFNNRKKVDTPSVFIDGNQKCSFSVGPKPSRRPLYNGFQIGTNTTHID